VHPAFEHNHIECSCFDLATGDFLDLTKPPLLDEDEEEVAA